MRWDAFTAPVIGKNMQTMSLQKLLPYLMQRNVSVMSTLPFTFLLLTQNRCTCTSKVDNAALVKIVKRIGS